jgi:hypothetical protein
MKSPFTAVLTPPRMRLLMLMLLMLSMLLLLTAPHLHAEEVQRTPLPASHPLLGTWRLDLPDVGCFEIYSLRANGTKRATSRLEIGESIFSLSAYPNRNGFYKWVDKIVRSNGKPDCMGEVSEVGHVATTYILLHPDGDQFLLCFEQNLNTCIGPFVRQDGI